MAGTLVPRVIRGLTSPPKSCLFRAKRSGRHASALSGNDFFVLITHLSRSQTNRCNFPSRHAPGTRTGCE